MILSRLRARKGDGDQYGMDDEFGMVALSTQTNMYLGGDSSLACAPETAKQIDDTVVRIVKEQHDKAKKILEDNLGKLHELAKYLYENETITGEEFMSILEKWRERLRFLETGPGFERLPRRVLLTLQWSAVAIRK